MSAVVWPGTRRIELRLASEQYQSAGGLRRHRGVQLGQGAYARVYLASESVVAAGREPVLGPNVVIKIYREDAPDDYNFVFRREVEMLSSLSGHDGIVALRDAEEAFPPTFICCDCGEPFYTTWCSDCGEPLQNDPEHRFALRCTGTAPHVFHRSDSIDVQRLTRVRAPCAHDGECAVVSFLFRPAIILDAQDVHLGELNDLLSRPEYSVRGYQVETDANPAADEAAYKRETFLLRLDCLIQAAESLAHVHQQRKIHADIAPENIMVSLGGTRSMARRSWTTRLTDFGRASPLGKSRRSEKVSGRPLFCAPEMFMINRLARASIKLLRGEESLRPGGEALMTMRRQAGEFLAEGDYVWDDWDGEYSVAAEQSLTEKSAARDDVGYLLRIARLPSVNDPKDLEQLSIYCSAALGTPADIYAFGR